jgi:hypothetical protein
MERLEKKRIKGHIYYYYSKWGLVNGKCRRLWQKYLGKPEDILHAVEGGGPRPQYAEVFHFGLAARRSGRNVSGPTLSVTSTGTVPSASRA